MPTDPTGVPKQSKQYKLKVHFPNPDVQQLNNLRDRYHRLVDEVFNQHENSLRTQIRQMYKVDMPDTSKLKVAID